MLVDDASQTGVELEKKSFHDRVIKEGMALWKKQKEYEKQKKLKEQQEVFFFDNLYYNNAVNYFVFSRLEKC